MKKILIISLLAFLMAGMKVSGQNPGQSFSEADRQARCDRIREACRFAWNGYLQYAAGYDELRPISKKGHNWYSSSLMMTPLDAFDTFLLMGMKKEAGQAKDMIMKNLDFNRDMEVQFFEISIRLLGSLISAYEMDGDKRFLGFARDLGDRLLPVFGSPTGMPYRYVNLKTGKTRDNISNPAEIGSCLMEFGKLTQYTGDSVYFKKAKKAMMELYARFSSRGLPGTSIDVNTGRWTDPDSHIGACIDSYYEYLFKSWKLYGDKDCRSAWDSCNARIVRYLPVPTAHGTFMTHVDMNTGKETTPIYGALDAFIAGLIAYSGNISLAARIQDANYFMWKRAMVEPEAYNFRTDSIEDAHYPLRPENIESCFYLYRLTGEKKYLEMGGRMTDDVLKTCRTSCGFARLKDVRTGEQYDTMDSFFFAETLKYAYLLFAPAGSLDLGKVVLTTEAHPLKIYLK